jgi:hypothetical protein
MILAASLSSASGSLICLIAALILFALAALNVPSSRVNLGWLGAFFLTLAIALG